MAVKIKKSLYPKDVIGIKESFNNIVNVGLWFTTTVSLL